MPRIRVRVRAPPAIAPLGTAEPCGERHGSELSLTDGAARVRVSLASRTVRTQWLG